MFFLRFTGCSIAISTYSMISHSGKRSWEAEQVIFLPGFHDGNKTWLLEHRDFLHNRLKKIEFQIIPQKIIIFISPSARPTLQQSFVSHACLAKLKGMPGYFDDVG